MKLKKAMPLVLAVVLGLVAMIMARKFLKPPAAIRLSSSTTPVVVATRDVPPGKELTAEDLATADIPTGSVPTKAFNSVADVTGRVVVTPLVKGQSVLEHLLAPMGAGVGLSALVPDGMRAMTVSIDEVTGLGGMILPGCHVDVMAIVPDERSKQQTSRTVLQNIRVVAVGRQFTASSGDAAPSAPTNNLTFLLTPEQARMLELAASTARPWLVLRSGRDGAPVKSDRTLIAELHGLSREEALGMFPMTQPSPTTGPSDAIASAAPSARRHDNFINVEVIRGGVPSRVTLPMPADLGGSGLPERAGSSVESTGGRPGDPANNPSGMGTPNNPALARTAPGRQGAESSQSARPTAEIDQSDAFNRDPFNAGQK